MNHQKKENNYCINRKDPSKLTKLQHLKEFIKGPCSPIAFSPGWRGTKLMVEIDCMEFRKFNPEVFKMCGFNACSKKFYEFWKKVPRPEYQIWATKLHEPFSTISFSPRVSKCFSEIFKPNIDLDKPID